MKKKATEYKIEKTLSSSKSVNIHLSTKNNLKQNYIMKQITLTTLNKDDIDLIMNEIKLLSSLDYKFVIKVIDSFQIDNIYYVILEYCDGGTLSDYLLHMKKTKKHLKEDLIWKLFIQITLGISYLHRNNILHRNIKPSNILLTKDFKAKIYGMKNSIKLMQNKKKYTNSFIGTPYYLAPEIWEERPYEKKVDIWALGILLYELCALDKPFKETNENALKNKIIEGQAEPIPKIYSKELQSFISFLLNKDELARPNIDEVILTYLFVSKSKSVHLYDYVIKLYPDIENKKLFIKSIKDRENEKKVYLKKNAVELYVNDTKNNYSDFFNQLKNVPIDTEPFYCKNINGIQIQSITRFLNEQTSDNSNGKNNHNHNTINDSSISNNTNVIKEVNDQSLMTQTFVPLVLNNETNFDFQIIDNNIDNYMKKTIDEPINDNGRSNGNNHNEDMIKITQAKLQRFQWIYEIEEKIDYLNDQISSILPDEKRKQFFNEIIANNKVNDDIFDQDDFNDPLLKKSYYNLVYYLNHLDKVKKEIFTNS